MDGLSKPVLTCDLDVQDGEFGLVFARSELRRRERKTTTIKMTVCTKTMTGPEGRSA
jgi:hypothetical protein